LALQVTQHTQPLLLPMRPMLLPPLLRAWRLLVLSLMPLLPSLLALGKMLLSQPKTVSYSHALCFGTLFFTNNVHKNYMHAACGLHHWQYYAGCKLVCAVAHCLDANCTTFMHRSG
jgi:hypothetical protein